MCSTREDFLGFSCIKYSSLKYLVRKKNPTEVFGLKVSLDVEVQWVTVDAPGKRLVVLVGLVQHPGGTRAVSEMSCWWEHVPG